jgi:hypothetical protein
MPDQNGWNTNRLDWQQQCPDNTPCPDTTWFWALAASLGVILLLKREGS